jgi:hypothetical protein
MSGSGWTTTPTSDNFIKQASDGKETGRFAKMRVMIP